MYNDIPTREIYWNISGVIWMYLLFLVALSIFVWKFYQRYRLWKVGRDGKKVDQIALRWKLMIQYALGQGRVIKERYPGVMHLLIYSGFIVLFIGTLLIFIQIDLTKPLFSLEFLKSTFYLYYSVTLDVFGVLAIIGILLAAYRRLFIKPINLKSRSDDLIILTSLLVILITGFIIE